MKRTPLKRKTPLKSRQTHSKASVRSALRQMSKSPVAGYKRRIQAALNALGQARDGGCIMRHYPESGECGGYANDGHLILQWDHILTRSNSATFADLRNGIILCKRHHIFWKKQYPMLWAELVYRHIGAETTSWIHRQQALSGKPTRIYPSEWLLIAQNLENKVKLLHGTINT
jgi:hypothetical protein